MTVGPLRSYDRSDMRFLDTRRIAFASAASFLLTGGTLVAPALGAGAPGPSVSAIVSPATQLAQAATGTITGTVVTAAGAPLGGAVIVVGGPTTITATSDSTGAFTVAVPPGLYRVSVSHAGFRVTSLNDITVIAGASQPLSVTLSALDLSSLQTIGRITTGRNGGTINSGAAVQSVVTAQAFQNYPSPQINDVLQRIPDVVIQKLGTQQDQAIVVGGLQPYETQVLIDGHPIALGQYGVWFSQYFPTFLVGSVETQSGPGNTTPFANIAVGGTANIQTPAFTTRTTAQVVVGDDTYLSQNITALFTGKIGNLSYVLGAGYSGLNDYFFHKSACDVYTPSPGPRFPGGAPGANQAGYSGIVAFCGDFSSSLINKGTVYKLKYDFSPTTSIEAGFVGSYGGFSPQGSAWGNSLGAVDVIDCVPGTQFCNNPSYSNLVGKTIQGYFWYPGTQLFNNQQLFTGQLRTSFGDTTLLIRPYLGSIQPETYDGGGEGAYPAFFSPDATYPPCPAIPPNAGPFDGPTSTCYAGPQTVPAGAKVPAVPPGAQSFPGANSFEYFSCPPGNIFAFQQLNSPSGTATTVNGRQLCYQYPYSTFELDTLYGTTFSLSHPIGDGFLDLTYDYHGQSTFAYANAPANIQVPYSGTRFSTISLTGDIRSIKNISIPFGIYNTSWTVNGQIINTNPNNNFCAGATAGDGTICGLQRYETHVDPHVAVVWRPNANDAVRIAYGTSTTYPFIGDLSGAPAFQPPASGYSSGLLTYKTPTLLPEHSLAFSIGADHRFANGSVLSLDFTNTIVHNVFQQILSSSPGDPNLGVFTPLNIALLQSKVGVLKYVYAPAAGIGFNLQVAADSSITSGIPANLMSSFPLTLPANNVQICGNGLFTPGAATCIPYLKGYGQFTYTSRSGFYSGLGFDYEGKNNAYYQPPFAIFDFTARQTLVKGLDLQISVQNLLNTNSYEHLAAPNLGTPITSNYTLDGHTILQGSYPTYLIPAATRTLRFQLRYHFGRA